MRKKLTIHFLPLLLHLFFPSLWCRDEVLDRNSAPERERESEMEMRHNRREDCLHSCFHLQQTASMMMFRRRFCHALFSILENASTYTSVMGQMFHPLATALSLPWPRGLDAGTVDDKDGHLLINEPRQLYHPLVMGFITRAGPTAACAQRSGVYWGGNEPVLPGGIGVNVFLINSVLMSCENSQSDLEIYSSLWRLILVQEGLHSRCFRTVEK